MARSAKRDQIRLVVGAALAPKPEVVDLKVFSGSARLALPPVAREHRGAKLFVFLRV
jgi:hypothetical protein